MECSTLARSAPPQTQTLSADTVAVPLAQDTSETGMMQGTTPLLPVGCNFKTPPPVCAQGHPPVP